MNVRFQALLLKLTWIDDIVRMVDIDIDIEIFIEF